MSFSAEDDEHRPNVQDDFYTFLGVNRNASETEITNAYRRLGRMFHPDKHKGDQIEAANMLFDRAKKAYEVLKDPHKRAIYDTLGEKALNDEELYAVIKYDKTPDEIRANYERLLREKEEKRLRELLHPRSSLTLGLNATNLFKRPTKRTRKQAKVRFSSMDITAAIDLPFRDQAKLSLTGLVSSKNNKGTHAFTGTLSQAWSDDTQTELHLTVAEQFVLKGKAVKCLTKRDILSTSAIFSPALSSFFSKEVTYVRLLSNSLTFQAKLASDLTDESSLITALTYEREKNKLELELSIGILVKSNHLSLCYIRSLDVNRTKLRTKIQLGLEETIVEYGCETNLTQNSRVGANLALSNTDGVSVKLTALVSNQMYALNIKLHDELTFAPIVYGSIGPVLVYACVKKYIVKPYEKSREEQKKQESTRSQTRKMQEKRREAELSISLMQESYRRSVQTEESSEGGLVIDVAIYGNADNLIEFVNSSVKNVRSEHLILSNDELNSKQLTLVTVPLQCLVKNSILSLPEGKKSNLPGFYDPCPNKEKKLYLRYKHRQSLRDCFCLDDGRLRLPAL